MAQSTSSRTGLPMRPTLDIDLQQAIATEEQCALALLDTDHFMQVNNDFGHDVGDELLKAIASQLQASAVGQIYHISGDEFALLLHNATLEQAFLAIERVRCQIEGAREALGLPDKRVVTVTLGVAQYPRDARDARGLWSLAGAALQTAKEKGGNQVSLPPNEEMIMKSCYYSGSSIRKLKALAERLNRKESPLLREALDDLIRKYDVPR